MSNEEIFTGRLEKAEKAVCGYVGLAFQPTGEPANELASNYEEHLISQARKAMEHLPLSSDDESGDDDIPELESMRGDPDANYSDTGDLEREESSLRAYIYDLSGVIRDLEDALDDQRRATKDQDTANRLQREAILRQTKAIEEQAKANLYQKEAITRQIEREAQLREVAETQRNLIESYEATMNDNVAKIARLEQALRVNEETIKHQEETIQTLDNSLRLAQERVEIHGEVIDKLNEFNEGLKTLNDDQLELIKNQQKLIDSQNAPEEDRWASAPPNDLNPKYCDTNGCYDDDKIVPCDGCESYHCERHLLTVTCDDPSNRARVGHDEQDNWHEGLPIKNLCVDCIYK